MSIKILRKLSVFALLSVCTLSFADETKAEVTPAQTKSESTVQKTTAPAKLQAQPPASEKVSKTPLSTPQTTKKLVAANTNKSNQSSLPNTWKPYFAHLCRIQQNQSTFITANAGIGMLYFSGIRGNLVINEISFPASYLKTTTPLQGRLNYNRTPLYELVFGYQFNNWFRLGLSFQAQTNVAVYSNWELLRLRAGLLLIPNDRPVQRFDANLTLYGLALKTYFNLPYALVWKMAALKPYLGLGVGPCWQTWKNMSIETVVNPLQPGGLPTRNNYIYQFSQKISANAMFLLDLGFTTSFLTKKGSFSITKGMKFNVWGQARSMGAPHDQQFVAYRVSMSNPLRIRTVYQWSPYLGLQWNY